MGSSVSTTSRRGSLLLSYSADVRSLVTTSSRFEGSTLYMFGGMVNEDRYSDLYAFNTATNHWTRLPNGPMVGRGGAGLVVCGDTAECARLLVIGGHVGHGVSDVWEYTIAAKRWQAREELNLPVPCSIFACGVIADHPKAVDSTICVFGGELNHTTNDAVAGQYSHDTLLLRSCAEPGECTVRVLPSSEAYVPPARGWTSGCVLKPEAAGTSVFAMFGGVREGSGPEPAGVRLGDLAIFEY